MSSYSEIQFNKLAEDIVAVAHRLYSRGWSPATSSNYSARLSEKACAITISGKDKGQLTKDDVMVVDINGKPLTEGKPSSETLLHTSLYQYSEDIKAILHVHSVGSTVLGMLLEDQDKLILKGYEILKAFRGITTHQTTMKVAIFENTQVLSQLAQEVIEKLKQQSDPCFGYLIRGHGLYVWGADLPECFRHLETFEYLFQCELERKKIEVLHERPHHS